MEGGDLDARLEYPPTTTQAQLSSSRQKKVVIVGDNDKGEGEYEDENEEKCVICLEGVSDRAMVHPCKHDNFDFLCLVQWIEGKSRCPLCNANPDFIQYQFADNGACKTFIPQQWNTNTNQTSQPQTQPETDHASRRRARLQNITTLHRTQHPRLSNTRRHRVTFEREGRTRPIHTPRLPPQDQALQRRRYIYRRQLYSLHVGSNRLSRFRDLTLESFKRDDVLISRARMFIRRELRVFEFLDLNNLSGSNDRRVCNAEHLLEYIVAILKWVDIQGSGGTAEDLIQEFLGRDNTRLFLHELRAWLRSPDATLEDWDRHVQYNDTPNMNTQRVFVQRPEYTAPRSRSRSPPSSRISSYDRDNTYICSRARRRRSDE